MSKNVIWWIGVKNDMYADKYGGWDWMDCSRKSWEFWCKKNDVLFIALEEPVETDLKRFRVNWQKAILAFDELDKRGIDYDQICLVDGAAIVKWDMPNFFELTDRKLTAWRDMDNMGWVHDSIKGYKEFFNGFELDQSKYVNSSPMIFNKDHKEVFQSFKNLYYDNVDKFVELQDKIVRRGTEQTPLNYWLQINNVEIKTDLSLSYKLTHIHRKQMFGHNWQLQEDTTPFFIKYGYIWYMQGFPKENRNQVSLQIWDIIKHNYDESYILNKIDHKDQDKDTTSNKFKEDILLYFKGYTDKTILELGSNKGNTTRVYAECFKSVIGIEHNPDNLKISKQRCSDVNNVEFILADVYSDSFKFPITDVVHIDAGHNHDQVCRDIDVCANQENKPILIFDDCSAKRYPDGTLGNTIRTAIQQKINEGKIELIKYIGANNGYESSNGKVLTGAEGMICRVI